MKSSDLRFGLIGHPIAGSGSPALFARAYGGRWPYDLIDNEDFESCWREFLFSYHAVNITAPFKEKAFRRVLECGRVDSECEPVGAINIAVKTPEGIVGYNSDYLGVKRVLLEEGFGSKPVCKVSQNQGHLTRFTRESVQGVQESGTPCTPLAIVVGFGGAGKAAAAAARSLGMEVVVCNRSRYTPEIRPLEDIPVLAPVADILIYTLSFPLPILTAGEAVLPGTVLEANYRTPCLENYGGRYIHGRRWLEAQAVEGYPLMTGLPCKLPL
ncbi:MAG: hypothetical protein IJ686_01725 [Bacteroidales bacterium]|nr:hypothetical protein [Bacteroidales bacterium]